MDHTIENVQWKTWVADETSNRGLDGKDWFEIGLGAAGFYNEVKV